MTGRFAAVRVSHAGGNTGKARLRPEQWLLIEWPANEAAPRKYILSTLPEDTPINELVSVAYQRWRIERDYQDLKQDFGLGHYEGRGWRGFHHHAALSIAAYGFLMAERLKADKSVGGKKKLRRTPSAFPFQGLHPPRQSCAPSDMWRPQSRHCASGELSVDRPTRAVSLLHQVE